ncbi:ATP-binding protein [Marinobacterium rhizophilum]|uniref:ATP-binding protein n=1 Tax=Marinobacterium rhizophilum TaxID=420402 RepID=UPI0003662C76|nr:ATP-binding protein [Marinobacterium rhizophilum]
MKWYRSLYWKIFLAIWLSSVLVIVATVLIVGSMASHERDAEVQEARAYALAERILERYEEGKRLDRFPRNKRSRGIPGIRIVELHGREPVIDTLPRHGPGARPELTFELVSESGRSYRVQVGAWPPQEPFGRFVGLLVSVQIVLILLVSALTSLVLTWLVVRPLKRLRLHTRALSEGDLSVRTDQKLAVRGDEIGELAREFDTMADYVERTLGASQRLMQDVSHELRAPLARLQAAAGLLEQRLGEGDPLLQRLNRECDRIDRLITEILSLSRLEALESVSEVFNVRELVMELKEDIRFQQPDRPLSIELPQSCRVRGNRQLLERALGNVFNNALKHTPAGAAIEMRHSLVGTTHELRIRDHGPGVAAEALQQLFDPFFRQRSDTRSDGYGLGLSIARRALRILGGSIEARNHPQGGLELLIRLPVA